MVEESKSYGLAWFLAGLALALWWAFSTAPRAAAKPGMTWRTAPARAPNIESGTRQAAEEVSAIVDKSKEQVTEYVERGKEAVDRGRAQWEEFVERGKSLVTEQTGRVTSAMMPDARPTARRPAPLTFGSTRALAVPRRLFPVACLLKCRADGLLSGGLLRSRSLPGGCFS